MRRAIVMLAVLASCATSARTTDVRFVTARGTVVIHAEVADTAAERARGLMGRRSLARDRGMLFVWTDAAPREFYMKNTVIPLDLVSVRAGRIVGIQSMIPCRAEPCPITRTPPADAALEVPAGVAAENGLRPGLLVDSKSLL